MPTASNAPELLDSKESNSIERNVVFQTGMTKDQSVKSKVKC